MNSSDLKNDFSENTGTLRNRSGTGGPSPTI